MEYYTYQSGEVYIGKLALGGNNPVRIQSMTSTPTMDTEATVAQAVRMIEAGCEYVRITAPFIKDAMNLKNIKDRLQILGYDIPLIADIHYLPKAAEIAAAIVEKVRINPGNYTDRKRGRLSFSDQEYQDEIDKIKERLEPLIRICKNNGTALRIGSNHGSLSERILLRYGDTPLGMVESAMEFLKICRELDFHKLVLSMKASNVKIMVQANRLLVKRMIEEGMNYPIHLGVTEAGDAEDGRIKSAAGIAPLLMDGIGDTIRVSLTEEPELELPVADSIRKLAHSVRTQTKGKDNQIAIGPTSFQRRKSDPIANIGGDFSPVVILDFHEKENKSAKFLKSALPDYFADVNQNKLISSHGEKKINFRMIKKEEDLKIEDLSKKETVLIFDLNSNASPQEIKSWFQKADDLNLNLPVILYKQFNCKEEELLVEASAYFAYFLVDGLGDGIWLSTPDQPAEKLAETAFGILQATGSRISKTEFIACPSCGRTLFKIQDTLQEIKARTSHLKGLKIAVMGCCVNGPGEMADADYGYVGAGKGKVSLYKGKTIRKQNIPESQALDELIAIMRTDGKWKDVGLDD